MLCFRVGLCPFTLFVQCWFSWRFVTLTTYRMVYLCWAWSWSLYLGEFNIRLLLFRGFTQVLFDTVVYAVFSIYVCHSWLSHCSSGFSHFFLFACSSLSTLLSTVLLLPPHGLSVQHSTCGFGLGSYVLQHPVVCCSLELSLGFLSFGVLSFRSCLGRHCLNCCHCSGVPLSFGVSLFVLLLFRVLLFRLLSFRVLFLFSFGVLFGVLGCCYLDYGSS